MCLLKCREPQKPVVSHMGCANKDMIVNTKASLETVYNNS